MSQNIDPQKLQAHVAKMRNQAGETAKSVNAILQKAIAETDEKRKLQLVAEGHEKLRNAKKDAKKASDTADALDSLLEAMRDAG